MSNFRTVKVREVLLEETRGHYQGRSLSGTRLADADVVNAGLAVLSGLLQGEYVTRESANGRIREAFAQGMREALKLVEAGLEVEGVEIKGGCVLVRHPHGGATTLDPATKVPLVFAAAFDEA